MKGVSDVIATFLMLIITVALAGMAYMYIWLSSKTFIPGGFGPPIDEKCGRLFEYLNMTEENVVSCWGVGIDVCNCEFCNRTYVFEDFYQEKCWTEKYKYGVID